MKKIVQDYFPEGKWEKMLSLTRLMLVALVCSIGTLVAAPTVSSAMQQQTQSTRRTVTGTVTNQDGDPVEGVSVSVRGATATGTTTDARGQYTINTARGATLEFTHVGMTTRTAQVNNQRAINITMRDESLVAEEVVVNTGGVIRPKESFTGNARRVTGDELRQASAGSVVTALRNMDPTFYVAENNLMGSNPNAMPIVTMRGSTSLPMMSGTTANGMPIETLDQAREYSQNANLPLLLIDNFISDFSQLVDMDENLIQDIVLMKDAAATAMYGTRAANGVISVTLKKPEPGSLRVSYTGGFSLQTPDLSSYDLMNASEKLEYERRAGLYSANNTTWQGYLSLQRLYTLKKIDVERGVNTDWLHYPLRVAAGQDHTLYVDGGEESFQYAGTVSYGNNPGVMKGSTRNNFRGSMRFQYNVEKFQFTNELSVSFVSGKDSPYATDGAFKQYALKNPYFTPYDDEGLLKEGLNDYDWDPQGIEDRWSGGDLDRNPLWDALKPQRHISKSMDVRNNFFFQWRIISGLTLRGQASVSTSRSRNDNYWSNEMTKFKDVPADKSSYKGQYNLNMGSVDRVNAQLTLQYNKQFNDVHMVTAGMTAEANQSKSDNYYFQAYGIANPQDVFFGLASHYLDYKGAGQPGGSDNVGRDVSLALSLNYIYDNRYFASFDTRVSGSSTFGANNRYAPTYSVGAGWNLHNEEFFQNDVVDNARFTINYGSNGSQNFPPGMSDITFRSSGRLYGQWGGNLIQGVGNKDLKWETTYSWDIGTDWTLFENRLHAEFHIFNKRTHDLIAQVKLPFASGFSAYHANIGKSENKGWELIANGYVLQDHERAYSLNIGLTAGHVKNTLLELDQGLDEMNEKSLQSMSDENSTSPAYLYFEGESRNMMYVKHSLGIDPISGHEIYLDENGKQTFDWAKAAMVKGGVDLPDIQGSFYTTGQWKNFRLTVYFHYEMGAKVYNQMLADKIEGESYYANMDRRAFDGRWYEVGQRAKYKSSSDASRTKATSRFVSDNDFFQLSSVDLTYDVPRNWSKRVLGIASMTVKGRLGEMFHFSTVKRERGLEYPFARTYNLTINARF